MLIGSNTVNQLWFSPVQLACARPFTDHLSPIFSYPPDSSSKLVEDQTRFVGVKKSHGNSKYITEIANTGVFADCHTYSYAYWRVRCYTYSYPIARSLLYIMHISDNCNYSPQKNDLCTRTKIGRVQRSFIVVTS